MAKTVYQTADGKFAVAYDKDQYEYMKQVNSVSCYIFKDKELKNKVYHRLQLKHITQLTLINQQ